MSWDSKIELLKEYMENHQGNMPRPGELYKGVNLNNWITTQRQKYKKGLLSQEQIDILISINFAWTKKDNDIKWTRNFNLLKEYIKEHNDKYPKHGEIYQGINIGSWVNTQRKIYNNGTITNSGDIIYGTLCLTKAHIASLNSIYFKWEPTTYKDLWNEKFELLKGYLEEYEGNYPSRNEIYRGVKLGKWVNTQRNTYNNGEIQPDLSRKYKSLCLSLEQINSLISIGFKWSANDKNVNWWQKFELFKQYLEEHNGRYPSAKELYKGIDLKKWINTQRIIYNNGEIQSDLRIKYRGRYLLPEQINKLNSINFLWDEYELKWQETYELLKEYLLKNNNEYPRKNIVYKSVNLTKWINMQRKVYHRGKMLKTGRIVLGKKSLTQSQINKLDAIYFNWNFEEVLTIWQRKFKLLQKYLEENNGKYPFTNEVYNGVNLDCWIKEQRRIHNKGTLQKNGSIKYNEQELTKEQIELLESIDFNWKTKKSDYTWEQHFNLLKEYLALHNGLYPEKKEVYKSFNIGMWIRLQQRIYINGTYVDNASIKYKDYVLTQDQIDNLNSIGFDWYANSNKYNDYQITNKYELMRLRSYLQSQLDCILQYSSPEITNDNIKIIESNLMRKLKK